MCVIEGSYSSSANAQHYMGQFPKVLVEGHIDVINPEELPNAGDRSIRIKLHPNARRVVATPDELVTIPVRFNSRMSKRMPIVKRRWFANDN